MFLCFSKSRAHLKLWHRTWLTSATWPHSTFTLSNLGLLTALYKNQLDARTLSFSSTKFDGFRATPASCKWLSAVLQMVRSDTLPRDGWYIISATCHALFVTKRIYRSGFRFVTDNSLKKGSLQKCYYIFWALKKSGNARPCSKSRKKVRQCVVKIEKKNLTWAPVIVWNRKKPSPFRASVECNHNKPS